MKVLVVLALVAAACAAPQQRTERHLDEDVQVLRYDYNTETFPAYKFSYELSDGQKREEQGEVRNPGADNQFIAVKGSYSYVGPDGITYVVTYVADENGFQPTIEQGPGGGVPGAVVASLLG